MSSVLVSGLVNMETTVKVRRFPIPYYPIDYPFFGLNSAVSGVAYNVALALTTLGDRVSLLSMTGADFPADYIRQTLTGSGIDSSRVKACLQATPASVVLYDDEGKRQIYSDLKDIQEVQYGFADGVCDGADLVVACNINFNRPLLAQAKAAGKPIATDVHVLSDPRDDYNRDFLRHADILFLSDEGVGEDYGAFLWELAGLYGPQVIVLGRGAKGAAMYLRAENRIFEMPAVRAGKVVNTVGAGDALFSAFVHFWAAGMHPVDALNRAQWFAAAKIRVSGASRGFVDGEELTRLMETGGK